MPLGYDESRRLSYSLRQPLPQNAATSATVVPQLSWPTEDETEQVNIVIRLSLQEYATLASAIDVGRDIAYGADSNKVWLLWLRILYSMSLCDDIADCIETSEAVQSAINTIVTKQLTGASSTAPTPISPAETAENLLPSGYTCDESHLCGMSRWVVTNLHDGVLQLLQQLENATNLWELAAEFVDNVEVVSYYGAALEFATWTQDQLIEYYDLAWSTTVEDTITCKIYCLIEPECELTVDLLIQAYEELITETFTLPDVNDILAIFNWLVGLDYETMTSTLIVATFHWFILQALRFGSVALNFTAGIRSFKQMVATGEDETDTYCASNCDCPAEGVAEFDFASGELGFSPASAGQATYSDGAWHQIDNSGNGRLFLKKAIPSGTTIIGVGVEFLRDDGSVSWTYKALLRDDIASSSGQVVVYSSSGSTSEDGCLSGSIAGANRNWLMVTFDMTGLSQNTKVTKVRINYEGTTIPDATGTAASICP